MLKKILIGLAILVLGFVAFVAMQPSDFRVERSQTMTASPADVFAQVNDLRKWEGWSPWAKLDPKAKVSFEGPDSGKGAAMTWAGNDQVGEGKMTIVDSRPGDTINLRVDIAKPHEGTSMSEFTFKPEGSGTAVTWAISAQHNFMEKAFCLIMNGKRMMSDLMDKGLAQMKSVVESGAAVSSN